MSTFYSMRDLIETIDLALKRGYAPSEILAVGSPVRDRIAAILDDRTMAAIWPAALAETQRSKQCNSVR